MRETRSSAISQEPPRISFSFPTSYLLLLTSHFLLLVSLLRPRPAQNVEHRVVALVAGVLGHLHLTQILLQVERCGPGARERRRILDGELVVDRVDVDAPEALDHMQAGCRTAVSRLRREIRDIDDERVAVPAASRVA